MPPPFFYEWGRHEARRVRDALPLKGARGVPAIEGANAPYEDWLRQYFYPLPVPNKKRTSHMRGSYTLPEFVSKTKDSRFGAMILELKTGRKRNKGSKRI